MEDKKFELTEDHVKLLRRMQVGWCDDEFGAPEIDPKRPYGNSAVIEDIYEIVTGEPSYSNSGESIGFTPFERGTYRALHEETQTALQVVLASGSFEPGTYVAPAYTNRWRRA